MPRRVSAGLALFCAARGASGGRAEQKRESQMHLNNFRSVRCVSFVSARVRPAARDRELCRQCTGSGEAAAAMMHFIALET